MMLPEEQYCKVSTPPITLHLFFSAFLTVLNKTKLVVGDGEAHRMRNQVSGTNFAKEIF